MFCGSAVSSTTGIISCGGLLQDTLSQDEVRALHLIEPGQCNSVFPSRVGPSLGVQFCLFKGLLQLFLVIFLKANGVGSANLIFRGILIFFRTLLPLSSFTHFYIHHPIGAVVQAHSQAIWKLVSQILVVPVTALQKSDWWQKSPTISFSVLQWPVGLSSCFFPPSSLFFAAG